MEKESRLALMKRRWSKRPHYARLRQYLPMAELACVDDREAVDAVEPAVIDWPVGLRKPRCGVVQDPGPYPRWTKYRRFLEHNGFEYGIYNLHAHDWLEKVQGYDVIIGMPSSEFWHLEETRKKYRFIEAHLGKATYPSPEHAALYEDKELEACLAEICGIPFAKTYVSHDRNDAHRLVDILNYPVVSKIFPASGSIGVELVRNRQAAHRLVEQAFSHNGRKSHLVALRQKNYIYLQEYIPSDGYDLRVIVVGNWLFGNYRKAPDGDFRASGMYLGEFRALPEEAMRIALQVNAFVKSPAMAVDMLHSPDGAYRIIEMSPITQVLNAEWLQVDHVAGAYIFDNDSFTFRPGSCWIDELALREFFLQSYLPEAAHAGLRARRLGSAKAWAC